MRSFMLLIMIFSGITFCISSLLSLKYFKDIYNLSKVKTTIVFYYYYKLNLFTILIVNNRKSFYFNSIFL